MAGVSLPPPPGLPPDCPAFGADQLAKLQAFEKAYKGTQTTPPGPATLPFQNGQDGLWAPPGFTLAYLGHDLQKQFPEVDARNGYTVEIPAGEVWRINWVAVDWITGTNTGPCVMIVRAFDDDYDLWYVQGRNTLPNDSGGPISFLPVAPGNAVDVRFATEAFPPRLYTWGHAWVVVQIANSDVGQNFLDVLRFDVDRWELIPYDGSQQKNGSGSGSGWGPPYFQAGDYTGGGKGFG